MHVIDIYVGEDEQRRRRRRGKWLIPLIVGCGAALALSREKPAPAPVPAPPKPVVAPALPVAQPQPAPVQTTTVQTTTVETPPVLTETQPPAPPEPARISVAPARLDFGDGPLTRGVPAQMAVIRNDGGEPLARVSASINGGAFLATNGCTEELKPGNQCMIAVVFTPKEPGTFNGSLKIAAGKQRAQVSLRGSVPRPPAVSLPPVTDTTSTLPPRTATVAPPPPPLPPQRTLCVQPKDLHFTSTGKQTITLTNPEPLPIQVVAILPIGQQGQTLSGYEIESRKCLRELKTRKQCKFTIRATDLALQRAERMTLNVYYDDPVTGGRRVAKTDPTCGSR